MAEKNETRLSWQVVCVCLVIALLLGLLFCLAIWEFVFFPNRVLPINSPKPSPLGKVLGQSDPQPSTPTPSHSPTPASTPAPTPVPTVAPSSKPDMNPAATLPQLPFIDSFESGLTNWSSVGDVILINRLKNPDSYAMPYQGNEMVRIGRPQNQGLPLSQNRLELRVPAGSKKLTFASDFFSYDYSGFDNPGFTVIFAGQTLFHFSAADIDTDSVQTETEHLESSHWQVHVLELPIVQENADQQLSFQAGNDEVNLPTEAEHQSWVYLDSIKIE